MIAIKFGSWRTQNKYINDAIEAKATHFDTYSEITLKPDHYSLVKIITDDIEVKGNYFYDIRVLSERGNEATDIDVLEIYSDAAGKELRCQYVNAEKPSLSPKEAARLRIYALIRGNSADTVRVNIPEVTELRAYEPRKARLAAVCIDKSTPGGRPRTVRDNIVYALEKIDELCADPAGKPDLVLFTERFHTMGVTFSHISESFISIDGDCVKAMREKAKEKGIYVCFSMKEVDKDNNYHNSAPLIDREGNIVLNYHKTHLTMGELAAGIVPGDSIAVYDTDFGRVGIGICWDMFFSDFASLLRDKNVDVILNPSLGYWDDINSMRAEDTGAYVLTAGGIPEKTAIIRPEGNYISEKCEDYGNIIDKADFARNGGVAMATVDLNEVFPVRYLSADSTADRHSVYMNEANYGLYKKYRG